MNRMLTIALALTALTLPSCSDDSTATDHSQVQVELRKKIASLDERMKQLGAKLSGDETEARYHDLMAQLEEQRESLEVKFERLSDATADKWDELRDEIEDGIDSMSEKLDDTFDNS